MPYDELIKALRGCVMSKPCDGCPYYDPDGPTEKCATLNIAAADAIEELQAQLMYSNDAAKAIAEKVPKWIPVTERLPNAGERVLCYCRANIYEVMKMRTDGDWVYDTNHIYMHSFVTHWMPLPEPPKVE